MSLQSFIDYLSTSFFCLLNLQCEYRKYVLQILIFFEYPFMFLPTDSFADFTLQPVVYGLLPYPILCCQIHHFLTTLHLPQYLYLHLPCYPCHILTFHFTAILQSLCIITGAGQPFRGIFASPTTGEFYFDTAALLGIVMYYLLVFLIVKALELFSKNPNQELA